MGNFNGMQQKVVETFGTSMTIRSEMKSFIDTINNLQEDLPFFDDAMKATKARIVIFYEDGIKNEPGRLMIGDANLLVEDLEKLHSIVLGKKKNN